MLTKGSNKPVLDASTYECYVCGNPLRLAAAVHVPGKCHGVDFVATIHKACNLPKNLEILKEKVEQEIAKDIEEYKKSK